MRSTSGLNALLERSGCWAMDSCRAHVSAFGTTRRSRDIRAKSAITNVAARPQQTPTLLTLRPFSPSKLHTFHGYKVALARRAEPLHLRLRLKVGPCDG